jgi:phospholipid/cholesterol/gamma-HCH transport system ATP-binding protein
MNDILYTPDTKPIIIVNGLAAGFDNNIVFENVSFNVYKGEILVIVGESGCGKSTLLKIMMGLLKPTRGSVLFKGINILSGTDEELDDFRQNIGVLFQSSALFSSMTIKENITLPLAEYTNLDPAMINLIVKMKLGMVNLAGYDDYYPVELSGGMKKRAGIARAIALDPIVLFFDELSAGLDPITAHELDELVIKTNQALGTTMVIVTHEIESIYTIADRVIMLHKDVKGIIAEGTPAELRDKSTDPRVHKFFVRERSGETRRKKSYGS